MVSARMFFSSAVAGKIPVQMNILGTISILIGFVCFVLAFFLLATPSKRQLANRLFATFLILTAIDISGWLWGDAANSLPWLNAFGDSLSFLQMPVFLGYIAASCYSDFRLRKWHLLLCMPFLLAFIFTLPGNQLSFLVGDASFEAEYLSSSEYAYFIWGAHVQYYFFIAACALILIRFRGIFRQTFSDGSSLTFRWLSQLVIVSIFAHTLSLVKLLVSYSDTPTLFLILQLTSAFLVLSIVTWITLKTLLQPDLFRKVDRTMLRATSRAETKAKLSTVSVSQKERLDIHMKSTEAFLDPDLTLLTLAEQLAMTPRELSELINMEFRVHFFDFVNRYRIEMAKTLLVAEDKQSVSQILYAVGFSSKSSFNLAFRKHTQTTPSAYRRSQAAISELSI